MKLFEVIARLEALATEDLRIARESGALVTVGEYFWLTRQESGMVDVFGDALYVYTIKANNGKVLLAGQSYEVTKDYLIKNIYNV